MTDNRSFLLAEVEPEDQHGEGVKPADLQSVALNKIRFALLAGMILAAAASRLIPHPPNFIPLAALALFGGASFASKRAAFFVPLAGLFLSDLVLGFYTITPVVYCSFALITCLDFWLRRRQNIWRIAGAQPSLGQRCFSC